MEGVPHSSKSELICTPVGDLEVANLDACSVCALEVSILRTHVVLSDEQCSSLRNHNTSPKPTCALGICLQGLLHCNYLKVVSERQPKNPKYKDFTNP